MRFERFRNPITSFSITKIETVFDGSWQLGHNGKRHLLIDLNWW
jgi:hypothetical protein